MQIYKYFCNNCHYFIETNGPWPYVREGKSERPYRVLHETHSGPIHGLTADVYCPSCDKKKEHNIVEYEKPLTSPDEIWLTELPRKKRMVCHRCKNPVFLIFPPAGVRCPRCKKGTFEVFEPLEEDVGQYPVPPPQSPLRVRQDGKAIHVPKPIVMIDSLEHMGYKFERFTNWFSGTVRRRLPVGDYTLSGMEEEVIVERKTIPDLVNSVIQDRKDFIKKCEKLSRFRRKCLVIEGSLSEVKTPYEGSQAHPNAVLGSLLAAQERWNIPVYFLDHFVLAEEFVASMLSKYHAFRWLEDNGYDRRLIEGDI